MTTADYDRDGLGPTVAHLGPGVFHRAHQAVYADDVLRTGSRTGGVVGISLRSSSVRDALAGNGFRYRVVERWDDAGSRRERTRVVGSLLSVHAAAADPGPALDALADPAVTVVTATVSEHGYCATGPGGPLDATRPEVRHDLEHPAAPRSVPGLLVEALRRRRHAGTAPFAVASCDNLTGNGPATARVVTDLAECLDPGLARWIGENVAFPSSMVDRMVPATPPEDLAAPGAGGWPVVTEPFSQWVLEDVFPAGRPPWERAGVELVTDARPHEQAKLRILNAAHSALAYWGLLAGHTYIHQACADPVLLRAVRALLDEEVLPTVPVPPGWDLRRYADDVLRRFGNRALPYTTAKVAGDGSQKLAVRVVPTMRALLATGRPATRSAAVLAAWVACVAGPRATALAVADAALPVPSRRDARALLGGPGLLDHRRPAEAVLLDRVPAVAERLGRGDVHAVLDAIGVQDPFRSPPSERVP